MTKTKTTPFALVLALALLLTAPAISQAKTRDRAKERLVGEWQMTSLEVNTDGTFQRVPYSGQIIFTKAGTMSVQAMNPDTAAPDTPYTMNGYEAFYGAYRVDKAGRTFAVAVQSAAVRNLIGQRLTRVFRVTGNRLVLTPSNPDKGCAYLPSERSS